MITNSDDIVIGKFYWLNYCNELRIGKAINWYEEVRFEVTGFDEKVEFDTVSAIRPVSLSHG